MRRAVKPSLFCSRAEPPVSTRPRATFAVAWICLGAGAGGCELIIGNDKLGERRSIAGDQDASFDAGVDASHEEDAGESATRCMHNQTCIDLLGPYHICHHQRGTCVSLLSETCPEVVGDYENDDALLLGSIGPTSGPNASTGLSNLWGIKLAVQDFTVIGNGLPPVESGGRRPIAVVHCDDRSNADQAVAGANHLANEVGVSAIIGPSFSGLTLSVASKVTIPAGVLTISPAATSAALTSVIDNDLLWRTAPSDVIQAAAQALLVAQVGNLVRQNQRIAAGNPLRLMMLYKGDAYGFGLADEVARNLIWNEGATEDPNAPSVQRFNYGDPGNPTVMPTQYDEAVAKVLTHKPHVVLLYGTGEVAQLMEMIETAWDPEAGQPRPHYVLADGGRGSEISSKVAQLDPDATTLLADRIFGTEPGFLGENYQLFKQLYVSKAEAPPVPITFGSANAYDALYVLAYASVVAGKTHPTGTELARGIARLVPFPGIPRTDVGATRINAALKELTSGGRIDLSGASGPLDFDLRTGDTPAGILFWCPQVAADGSVKFVPTLETYDPVLGEIVLAGEETIDCGHPDFVEDPIPL